jgi:hypothetical protein
MLFSFKQYLLGESGNAVKQWVNGQRASAVDIHTALKFVSKHTGIPLQELHDNLLGSTTHTLAGKQADSGDVDIAIPAEKYDVHEVINKLKDSVNGETSFETGLKTYSFAIPVSDDKKIQVDLMIVNSKDWAKFAYNTHSSSKYKGVVRNQILFAVVTQHVEPGKDVVVKNEDGQVIARASRSLKFDTGIERLFKLAGVMKNGKRKKTLDKVSPDVLQSELEKIDPTLKFDPTPDPIIDPKRAAEWMFGKGTKPEDIDTAEKVIHLIKTKFKPEDQTNYPYRRNYKHHDI